jgi:hypothetical protein
MVRAEAVSRRHAWSAEVGVGGLRRRAIGRARNWCGLHGPGDQVRRLRGSSCINPVEHLGNNVAIASPVAAYWQLELKSEAALLN